MDPRRCMLYCSILVAPISKSILNKGMMQLNEVVQQFGIEATCITPYGSGLINRTWIVTSPNQEFILQQINTAVFKNPEDIAFNIRLIADHLKEYHPEYLFISPLQTVDGREMVVDSEKYF